MWRGRRWRPLDRAASAKRTIAGRFVAPDEGIPSCPPSSPGTYAAPRRRACRCRPPSTSRTAATTAAGTAGCGTPDTRAERGRELDAPRSGARSSTRRAPWARREWAISGGEPMLRDDFAEIFDYVTAQGDDVLAQHQRHADHARDRAAAEAQGQQDGRRLRRHRRGLRPRHAQPRRLRGAAAGPRATSRRPAPASPCSSSRCATTGTSGTRCWRSRSRGAGTGGSARRGSSRRPAATRRATPRSSAQRLDPADVVELDEPDLAADERAPRRTARRPRRRSRPRPATTACTPPASRRRRDFHVDPYGGMTLLLRSSRTRRCATTCAGLRRRRRRALRRWEEFIPSLADTRARRARVPRGLRRLRPARRLPLVRRLRVPGARAPRRQGGASVRRGAREPRRSRSAGCADHRRFYEIAGITVQVESDLPITDATFDAKFASFARRRARRRHGRDPPPLRPARHWTARSAGKRSTGSRPGRSTARGRLVDLPGHLARRRTTPRCTACRVQRRPHARRASTTPTGSERVVARRRPGAP